jgi:hypothetical protein
MFDWLKRKKTVSQAAPSPVEEPRCEDAPRYQQPIFRTPPLAGVEKELSTTGLRNSETASAELGTMGGNNRRPLGNRERIRQALADWTLRNRLH